MLDDLSALFSSPESSSAGVSAVPGLVMAWDDATASNVVRVNGTDLQDLRVITAGPAISIEAGDTVELLKTKTQYFILGKVAAPGASAAIRSVSDFVTTGASITSTTFTDLSGSSGPTASVYVGSSGKVLVMTSCFLDTPGAGSGGQMSFALSGANVQSAVGYRGAWYYSDQAGARITISGIVQVVGLAPGLTTFTSKYLSMTGGSVSFLNRSLIVIPF
jgi:hypothetical protein